MLKNEKYKKILLVIGSLVILCVLSLLMLKFLPNTMTYGTYKDGDQYRVSIGKSNGEIVFKDTYNLEPILSKVGKNTVMVTAGRGDSWSSRFINGKTGKVSDYFENVSAYNEKLVVYATYDNGKLKIIIRDIYDKNNYYKEIIDTFPNEAVPSYVIKDATVINDHLVYLNYYVGEAREEKGQFIFLD